MTVERGSVSVASDVPWRLELPAGAPPEGGWPLVVGLHGFSHDGPSLAARMDGLSDALYARLWPDGLFPVEVGEGDDRRIGRSWYQYDGDQERFVAALERAAEFVEVVVEAAATDHPIDRGRRVILGYSMGGYVAGWAAFRAGSPWAGLVALATRVKSEVVDLRNGSGLPVLVMHGEDDRFIPAERARQSAERLREGGAQVTFETWDGGHGLRPPVSRRVDLFLRDVFGVA